MRTIARVVIVPTLLLVAYHLVDRLTFLGAFRRFTYPVQQYALPGDYFQIPEIIQAEDIAFHAPSNSFVFLSQSRVEEKYGWWPAWAVFDRPEDGLKAQAQLWLVDAKTLKPEMYELESHDSPFTVHGIDIYPDLSDDTTFYLHAVNHPPQMRNGQPTGASDSRIEIFLVDVKTKSAKHLRSVQHPLIARPNDIFSLGPEEMLVTNDHVNARGILRTLEDFLATGLESWTHIAHIKVEAAGHISGKVVADRLHNANGLGHGPNNEVVLGDASGGQLTTFTWSTAARSLVDTHRIPIKLALDNPVWFEDPYANLQSNASGYILAGLLSGIHLDNQARDINADIPSSVWIARERGGRIEKRLLFTDDGTFLSGAATAVIVPIDPSKKKDKAESGRRYGWIVATGPWSRAVSVVKVDLTAWAKASRGI